MTSDSSATPADRAHNRPDLSILAVTLLKGVVYREEDERAWSALLDLQARLREYMAILRLELILDEAEGYAFLRSMPDLDEDDGAPRPPRLIARRPLSFPVSLLLALLRKKLAEFDAAAGETRLVLTREAIVELIRVFLPEGSDDVKLIGQIETHINRLIELGFLRRLKPLNGRDAEPASFEVRRILKAFVDAQWLTQFDGRLAAYQARLMGSEEAANG
jgi:hypothetical protein